ncbi:MAG: hypothetical protein ACP5IH_08715, partial [Desulfurella sp.]|uniref:hypothetical protein n=1 Tax=Desulfurella sp. TaxID=1962857 RepID=UPI003D0BDE9C
MSRSDLVKWSMTGGEPQSCAMGNSYSSPQCDPTLNTQDVTNVVLYPSINDYYNLSTPSFSVLTPLSRINQAILPSLQNMSSTLRPRMGLLMFTTPLGSSGTPYTISHTVYIGGYPYNQSNYKEKYSTAILSTNPYTYIMRF